MTLSIVNTYEIFDPTLIWKHIDGLVNILLRSQWKQLNLQNSRELVERLLNWRINEFYEVKSRLRRNPSNKPAGAFYATYAY